MNIFIKTRCRAYLFDVIPYFLTFELYFYVFSYFSGIEKDDVIHRLSSINDSVTTITLTSGTGFPTRGSVFIGSERIDYTGKSSNDLTGCTRGSNNTDAASHSDNATVKTGVVIIEGDTSTGTTLKSSFDPVY